MFTALLFVCQFTDAGFLDGHTFGDVFRAHKAAKSERYATGNNLEVLIWPPDDKKPLRIELAENRQFGLGAIALDAAGDRVAVGHDAAIGVYATSDGHLLRRISLAGAGGVSALAFSPDGKQLWACVAGEDGDYATNALNVYDAESGTRVAQLYKAHVSDRMTSQIVFARDKDLVIAIDAGKTGLGFEVFTASTRKSQAHVTWKKLEPTAGVFSPDDTRFFLGVDRKIRVYDVGAWKKPAAEWIAHVGTKNDDIGYIRALHVSQDGRVLLSQSDDKDAVRAWDTATRKQLAAAAQQVGRSWNMVASADGKRVVVTGNKKRLQRLQLAY